ncbi:MAG: trans-sulfuration enzyme family protein [Candidatus Promineifilaceae bacterium]|jgi:O-succinylhomoserine sulfhydrylase
MSENKHHLETRIIRTRVPSSVHNEQVTPIYVSSGFNFESAEMARAVYAGEEPGYVYSRWKNPNNDELISRMCILEGAEAGLTAASGMAAMYTLLTGLLSSGDLVVAARALFSATNQIIDNTLPRWGISHSYFEGPEPETWEAAFTPQTRLCIVESPSNPALSLVDIGRLAELCRARDVVLVVDNTFATPIVQQPLALGAHLVVHSTTKFLDGQGRTIGGVIVGEEPLIEELFNFSRSTGPTLSSFNAWILSLSLELLPLRMERHCANALALATRLQERSDIANVLYPYLPSHPQYALARKQMKAGGGIVTFEIAGGVERGRRFLNALQMCDIVTNLGDARTIATHPASTTHSKLSEEQRLAAGITAGLVRVSVGLEHVDDIIDDIEQALDESI